MIPFQTLIAERVTPWVERLPWQSDTPVRYDESEGYKGRGVIGCRAGPMDSIGFEHLAHELAHAFEILESKDAEEALKPQWGMTIRNRLQIGAQVFFEPLTFEPSQRECRTTGIQRRLLEMVGHPAAETIFDNQAFLTIRRACCFASCPIGTKEGRTRNNGCSGARH